GARRRLYRHPANPRGFGRGSVPVPASLYPRGRRLALVRFGALVPRAAGSHRYRLRSDQQRTQSTHAVAHPGAADLSRCAAVPKISGWTVDHHHHAGGVVADVIVLGILALGLPPGPEEVTRA